MILTYYLAIGVPSTIAIGLTNAQVSSGLATKPVELVEQI